nr:hypothetical protein DBT45_04645 [Aerococcus tenax]
MNSIGPFVVILEDAPYLIKKTSVKPALQLNCMYKLYLLLYYLYFKNEIISHLEVFKLENAFIFI